MGSTRDEAVQLFNDATLTAEAAAKVRVSLTPVFNRQSVQPCCVHTTGR
jgi:hypothetical protein